MYLCVCIYIYNEFFWENTLTCMNRTYPQTTTICDTWPLKIPFRCKIFPPLAVGIKMDKKIFWTLKILNCHTQNYHCYIWPLPLFVFIAFFLHNRGNMDHSSLKNARASHICQFLSILMPISNGWATSQQNTNLRGSQNGSLRAFLQMIV